MFGLSELALILIVAALVIGAKKLPELARSAGKAARILKSERQALKAEGQDGADRGGEGRGRTDVIPGEVVKGDPTSGKG